MILLLVEGEPDARPMGIGSGRKPPSYNVQTAVDAATGLIVHHEVMTEPTDNRLLHPMAKATKDAVEADTLTVVAIAGNEAADDKKDPVAARARGEKRRANRGALPAHLPRVDVTIEPELRRNDIQPLRRLFADHMHGRPAAGAIGVLGLS